MYPVYTMRGCHSKPHDIKMPETVQQIAGRKRKKKLDLAISRLFGLGRSGPVCVVCVEMAKAYIHIDRINC